MNIYFSGFGGVAIGPLAEIALDAGYTVTGSDANESLMTKRLSARGITITTNQDGTFLSESHSTTPYDWFVYTAALPDTHPELVRAKELGIKTAKRDELIAHIIAEKNLKLIAISGTHGKTTTTGMIVWSLLQQNVPVSYSVGTTLSFGPSGAFNPESEYFIYECDEFDRNFLHFSPYLSLITSLDYDHPDTYPTESDYKAAFRRFINQSSHTVLWERDAQYINSYFPNAWTLRGDEVASLTLPGIHMRANGTLALKALEYLRIGDDGSNRAALNAFPGTDRRFEKLGDNLYTDYGHHPAEIAATLQLARELSDYVVLVYQPHQNVRQHEIAEQYTDATFDAANELYWLPTYLTREDPTLEVLTPQTLTQQLKRGNSLHLAELNDALWRDIQVHRSRGHLVLCMGAGTIDSWVRNELSN
jgi:UDP-N-acetylmuramate--alanine ligase